MVSARGERVVRLRDLADVGWSAEEERYLGRFNGKRAVFVTASMKDNQNVFDVRNAIYERLPQFETGLARRTSGSSADSTSRRTSTAACRASSSTSRSRSRSSP